MELENKCIGFAMTGSYCTFATVIEELRKLKQTGADIQPIMSENVYNTDTRFGKAEDFIWTVEDITRKKVIKSIKEAEPIGPKKLLDLLIVSPCTGNTLAKLANGITDTSVTLAVKAHLRNQRPVLLGVSTNDGLGNAAKNIGTLLNVKNMYFIPFNQDDFENKPNSLVADFTKLIPAAKAALEFKQLQPVLLRL